MSDLSTHRLADLVRKKRQVLEQLRQAGVRQGELVDTGDVASLLKLLAAKQQLLGGLQSLERSLAPFREQDPDAREWANAEQRARCSADAAECARLLEEVVAMERSHEQRMVERRDQVAQQLRLAQSAKQATGAYRGQRGEPHRVPVPGADQPLATGLDLASG